MRRVRLKTGRGKRQPHPRAHLNVRARASLASCGTASLFLSLNTTSAHNHRLATLSSNKPRENGKSLKATCDAPIDG